MRKILVTIVASMTFSCVLPTSAQAQHATCTTATAACGEQIVKATYAEFPTLANDGMNTDAMEQLLRRMLWHMQLNGLQAHRQKNPSGRISQDKMAAFIDGQWRAYDVLSDRADPGPFRVQFDEVPGANPQPNDPNGPLADEGGTPTPPPTGGGDSILDAIEREGKEAAARDEQSAAASAARDALILAELTATHASLEEHRAEARKTRSAVMGFLSNWRNYVKIGSAVVGTLIGTGNMPGLGGQ